MSKKRFAGGMIAAAMAINSMLMVPFATSAAAVKVEAETGTLVGTGGVKTSEAGYSGDGYMYLEDNGDVLNIPVTVSKAGMYTLTICYQNNFGSDKIQNIVVNDVDQGQMSFPENPNWSELTFGNVKLNAGENTITIKGSWGWTNFDYITLEEASLGEIKATQINTCDPDATEPTKQLMAYLASVYGEHILSGQQEIYQYGPHSIETEFEYIESKTGKLPAIRGFDYGNFTCPAFGSDDGSTDRVIAWAAKGGIATASWHINVPKDFASYSIGDRIGWDQTTYKPDETDFSPSKAATEGTKENQYYTQALDNLAEQFLILQEKGIPIIWRPLHEAEGGGGENGSWFWWGKEGSKVYRQLYIYTYKYLTETKGCHNLIWEFNSYNYSTSENWYPGDAYVDIIGYDKYNCTDWSTGSPVLVHNDSAISSTFYGLMEKYNSAKMIAMAECDCFSTVENLTSEKAGWLYFLPWYDGGSDDTNFLSNPMFNTEEDLIEMYQSEYCITLDELPKFTDIEVDQEATNAQVNTEPEDPEEGHAVISQNTADHLTTIDLPEASDVIYLVVDAPSGTTYANGGLGVSVPIDGVYYWANIQWEVTGPGTAKVDLVKNFLNASDPDGNLVENETIIDAIKAAVVTKTSFQGQYWYAEIDGEKDADKSEINIVDAYVVTDGEEPTQEPTEAEQPTEEQPTESEEPATQGSLPEVTVWGDADDDGDCDIIDVITVNKEQLGSETLSEQGQANADVDQSGDLSFTDAVNIMKSLVDLVTLPVPKA